MFAGRGSIAESERVEEGVFGFSRRLDGAVGVECGGGH